MIPFVVYKITPRGEGYCYDGKGNIMRFDNFIDAIRFGINLNTDFIVDHGYVSIAMYDKTSNHLHYL